MGINKTQKEIMKAKEGKAQNHKIKIVKKEIAALE